MLQAPAKTLVWAEGDGRIVLLFNRFSSNFESMERTLILLKPNAVQRGLVGEILARFERRGLTLLALKLMQVSRELAERHYAEHLGKPFYPGLLDFITSAPTVAAVLEGEQAIELVRRMCGETDPRRAAPGTIRGDYGVRTQQNLIHASDSPESAGREIGLFFAEAELLSYRRPIHPWV